MSSWKRHLAAFLERQTAIAAQEIRPRSEIVASGPCVGSIKAGKEPDRGSLARR
jgi:hypothetical protein